MHLILRIADKFLLYTTVGTERNFSTDLLDMSIDYAHTPALPPPPGVTPNFVDPESQANLFVSVTAVCIALMLPIVIMRLYSRVCITRSFAIDDGPLFYARF